MPVHNYKKGTFSNLMDLENGMASTFRVAQDKTLEKMKEKLDDFISDDVYMKSALSYYNKSENQGEEEEYQRTFDLYNIWETKRLYSSHGKVYGSIEPTNHGKLSHNSELHQHTSPKGRNHKRRELTTKDYVHIINDGLSEKYSMFGEIQARPFWDDFMKWATKNYPIIFKEECAKLGISLK